MADPIYAPLRGYGIMGDPADTPLSALSDQTYISPDESRLVEQLHDALQPCYDQMRVDVAEIDPRFNEVLTAEYEASDQNIVDFVEFH